MQEIRSRLSEQGIAVDLTEAARVWLAREGFDPAFGARPLRRALQKHVESPLSVMILEGKFKTGDTVLVDYAEGQGILFTHREEQPAEKVASPAR
jgi:ATP-dependent Clp protease ATP-binding subunit ClpC